jgi:hypothetical protein
MKILHCRNDKTMIIFYLNEEGPNKSTQCISNSHHYEDYINEEEL